MNYKYIKPILKNISVRMPAGLVEEIDKVAKKKDLNRSEAIIILIEKGLEWNRLSK